MTIAWVNQEKYYLMDQLKENNKAHTPNRVGGPAAK